MHREPARNQPANDVRAGSDVQYPPPQLSVSRVVLGPLVRQERTSEGGSAISPFDPKRTSPAPNITPIYTPTRVTDCLAMLLARLACDAVLDAAYAWLCHRRRDYPADADVWSLRRLWPVEKNRIQADLLAGDYRFGLLDRITLADGSDIDLWCSRDALVLKALTMVLTDVLPVSSRCTHIKGNGGAPKSKEERRCAA